MQLKHCCCQGRKVRGKGFKARGQVKELRTRGPRTRTCKLVLEKDFSQGQQYWVTVKNGSAAVNYLILVSKRFFTTTSCIVAVTEFMDLM